MQARRTLRPTSKVCIAVLFSAACLASRAPANAVGEVNRIVLRVNEEIATLWDYEKLKREQLAALAQATMPEGRRQAILAGIGEQTMQNLFQELLVLSRARQVGVVVSDEQISTAMARTLGNFGVTDPNDYEAALAQNGLTVDTFREQMRRNMAIQEVIGREVQQRVNLVEEDLRRYYRSHSEEFRQPKKIRLREVVVLDSSDLTGEEREELAADLRGAIATGSVDEELEDHKESGRSTGWIEHGWVVTGDLDTVLATTADNLAAGEVSEPVAARGGLHLLQVVELQESAIQEFNDVRDQIEEKERNRLFEIEMEEYMEELVDSSHIVSKPPPDAASFRPVLEKTKEARETAAAGLDAVTLAADSVPVQATVEEAPVVEPFPPAESLEEDVPAGEIPDPVEPEPPSF